MLGDRATDEAVQRLTRQLGLDQSIFAQFIALLLFLGSATLTTIGTWAALRRSDR